MLFLRFGNDSQTIVVTLNEKKTLDAGGYIFKFTHVTTKQVVMFYRTFDEDMSNYPERYNEFEINTDEVFEDAPTGQWQYEVFESVDEVLLDNPTEVENGKMLLQKETPLSITGHEPTISYTGYAG